MKPRLTRVGSVAVLLTSDGFVIDGDREVGLGLPLQHLHQLLVDGVEPCFGVLVICMVAGSGKTFCHLFKLFLTKIELKRAVGLLDAQMHEPSSVKQQRIFQVVHLPLGQCEPKTIWGAHLFIGV